MSCHTSHLRHLHSLTLAPTSGADSIAAAKAVFIRYLSNDFENSAAASRADTLATEVHVYEMTDRGLFTQLFGSLADDPRKLCLTEGQIVEFCRTHRDRLRKDNNCTFFLYEGKDKELLVAEVLVFFDGLEVYSKPFLHDAVWWFGDRHRLVVR